MEAAKLGDMCRSAPSEFQQRMEATMTGYNGPYARLRRRGLVADICGESTEMREIFESVLQGGGGQFLVGMECMRRMQDLLLVHKMSRDEQHLAELFILGTDRSAINQRRVPKTGRRAKGVRRGPRIAPRRYNICSLFRRKIIKSKGHKCSGAAKKAVGAMNQMQLSREVDKMLREAENES